MDPTEIYTSGLNWLNLSNGTQNGRYFETRQFAKGGAIGGVTSVIAPVGIEIGNRVWLDRNGNGIQDANTAREPGIPGEVVQLPDSTGKVLPATTTDADGNYYFNSNDIAGFAPNGGKYSVAFANPSTLPTTDPNYKAPTAQAVPAYVVDGTTIAPAITWGQLQLTTPTPART